MHLLSNYEGPRFYVDVGCHHPKRGSNTYAFYRQGWQGLLIDLEEEKLLACRLARPRDSLFCGAISDSEKEVKIYSDKSFSTLSTIQASIARDLGLPTVRTTRTHRLETVLKERGAPAKYGLLSVDVEGSDFEVLKGAGLRDYRPAFICVEDLPKANQSVEMAAYLHDAGYISVAKAGPSLIWKDSLPPGVA